MDKHEASSRSETTVLSISEMKPAAESQPKTRGPTAHAGVSSRSGHRYPLMARAKAATAGEKRRPAIDTSDTSRTTSGSATSRVSTPGMVGENSGIKRPGPRSVGGSRRGTPVGTATRRLLTGCARGLLTHHSDDAAYLAAVALNDRSKFGALGGRHADALDNQVVDFIGAIVVS